MVSPVIGSTDSGSAGLQSRMLYVVRYLFSSIVQGLTSCLATVDTSKAFDGVQRRRLLTQIGWYGVDSHQFEKVGTEIGGSVCAANLVLWLPLSTV